MEDEKKPDKPAKSENDLLASLSADAGSFQEALIESSTKFEQQFRRDHPGIWWGALLGPMVLTCLVLGGVWIAGGFVEVQKYVVTALITFFLFGRFVIPATDMISDFFRETEWLSRFSFSDDLVVTSMQAFFMLTYMDFMVALIVTFHMGMLFRIPYVGPKLGMMVYDAKFILDRYSWIKRLSFFGLVIFVIFPASTTGSIGGSIFGRMMGLSRMQTLGAILIGSILGNLIMLQFAEVFSLVKDSWVMRGIVFAIIVAIIVGIEWRYRQLKKRFMAAKEESSSSSPTHR